MFSDSDSKSTRCSYYSENESDFKCEVKISRFCHILMVVFLKRTQQWTVSAARLQPSEAEMLSVCSFLPLKSIGTSKVKEAEHKNTWKKITIYLIPLTSEFKLRFKGCHENLSAKFKVKTTPLRERDCHSSESSIQGIVSSAFEK